MRKAQCQLWCTPVGPIKEAIEEFVKYLNGIVLKVAPVIFDDGVGGRCFDVTGKVIDSIELLPCQRPITGHKFVTLIFAHKKTFLETHTRLLLCEERKLPIGVSAW